MADLQQIAKTAQEIIQICEQGRTNKADKERLLKLQEAILTHIESLTECEVCGSITDLVVTMTIEPVTAKLCKDCGINAIEAGKIKKATTRKRPARTVRKNVPTAKKKSSPQQAPPQEPRRAICRGRKGNKPQENGYKTSAQNHPRDPESNEP